MISSRALETAEWPAHPYGLSRLGTLEVRKVTERDRVAPENAEQVAEKRRIARVHPAANCFRKRPPPQRPQKRNPPKRSRRSKNWNARCSSHGPFHWISTMR